MLTRIRAATSADIPAIVAIERATQSAAHWSGGQYEARLAEPHVLLVAECDKNCCGFLCARVIAGEWDIENVVVEPAFRRRGVAAALMGELVARWEAAAGEAILLEVREGNAAARALYEKFGLREIGRRRSYYRDPVEDAILYERHQNQQPNDNGLTP